MLAYFSLVFSLLGGQLCVTETSYLKTIILKHNFPHFGTWIPDSRHFQPVLGRKFHEESDVEVKNNKCRRTEAKTLETLTYKQLLFNFD